MARTDRLPITDEQYFLLQVASDREKSSHFFKYIAFQMTIARWVWFSGGLVGGLVIGWIIGDLG